MRAKPSHRCLVVAAAVIFTGWGARLSQAQPANDLFIHRMVLTGTNVLTSGSTIGATREAGEPAHANAPGGASVWWTWTAPASGTVIISTAGSSFDTVLAVYEGLSINSLAELASNDDENYPDVLTSKVVFDVTAGQVCQIAVDGYGGVSGAVQLQIVLGPLQPPPPAPAWRLPDPHGVMVNSTNYAGKVVILDFWATWCGPCKLEIPDLVYLQNRYRADGLVIVGASVDNTSQDVLTFVATNSPALNYQVVMADAAMAQAYGGIDAIPTTFVINRNNGIVRRLVGTQSRSTFERQIFPLLYGTTRLDSQPSGNNLQFRWRVNALASHVESSPSLRNPVWTTWPTAPGIVNGTNLLTIPWSPSNRYFRLRFPY